MGITRADVKFFVDNPDMACLCAVLETYATCAPFCKNIFSNLPKIGMIAGSVLLTASAFYGDSYLYPATIVGFSYCTWLGTRLSPVFSREETAFFEDDRPDCAYAGVLSYFLCKEPCHSYAALGGVICKNLSKIGVVAGSTLFLANTLYNRSYLYPVTITGLAYGIRLNEDLFKVFWQKISKDLNDDNVSQDAPRWIEFKRWAPVSKVKVYKKCAFSFNKQDSGSSGDVFSNLFKPISSDVLEFKESKEKPAYFSEVRAFTNGIDLKYETITRRKHKWNKEIVKHSSGPIQMDRPLQEMKEILKECFVVLEDDETPTFSPSYHYISSVCEIPRTGPNKSGTKTESARVNLLLGRSGLVWNIRCRRWKIFHGKRKKSFSIQGIALSKKCAEYTREFFKKTGSASLNDQINLVKYLYVEKCSPDKIRLRPGSSPCGFNIKVSVSAFMWAVTLVKYQGFKGNHAQIIVEGINDGFISEKTARIGNYFTCMMDLVGYQFKKDGKGNLLLRNDKPKLFQSIRIDVKKEFKWRYDARSEIWKRPNDVVKKMILESYKEKNDPPEGFSLYGCDSVFTLKEVPEHSCITWAIEKLAIAKIFLEKKPLHSIATYTSFYTPFEPGHCEENIKDAKLV